jgi:hypothetical protein
MQGLASTGGMLILSVTDRACQMPGTNVAVTSIQGKTLETSPCFRRPMDPECQKKVRASLHPRTQGHHPPSYDSGSSSASEEHTLALASGHFT